MFIFIIFITVTTLFELIKSLLRTLINNKLILIKDRSFALYKFQRKYINNNYALHVTREKNNRIINNNLLRRYKDGVIILNAEFTIFFIFVNQILVILRKIEDFIKYVFIKINKTIETRFDNVANRI